MSSYAINAIHAAKMLSTPSTFRRRNISNERRTKKQVSRNGMPKQPNSKTVTIRNQLQKKSSLVSKSYPPSSLTVSNNFALSQLTCSQLSDSLSYQRSTTTHNEQLTQEGRPSKVARTRTQTRPSRFLRSSSTISCSRSAATQEQKTLGKSIGAPFGLSNHDAVRSAFDSTNTSRTRSRSQRNRLVSNQARSNELSQLSQLEDASDSMSEILLPSSQKRATNRRNSSTLKLSNGAAVLTSKNTAAVVVKNESRMSTSSARSSSRKKRSWMDACRDVISTPYRATKTITRHLTKPLTNFNNKIKTEEVEEIHDDDKLFHDAKQQEDDHVSNNDNSFETPSRALTKVSYSICHDHDSEESEDEVKQQEHESISSKSNNSATPQINNELKEMWKKIELAKEEIEKERKEIQDLQRTAVEELQRETKIYSKHIEETTKERMELKSMIETIRKDHDEKSSKFATNVWAANEKCEAMIHAFDVKYTDALEGIRTRQSSHLSEMKTNQSSFVNELFDIKDTALKELDSRGSDIEKNGQKLLKALEKKAKQTPSERFRTTRSPVTNDEGSSSESHNYSCPRDSSSKNALPNACPVSITRLQSRREKKNNVRNTFRPIADEKRSSKKVSLVKNVSNSSKLTVPSINEVKPLKDNDSCDNTKNAEVDALGLRTSKNLQPLRSQMNGNTGKMKGQSSSITPKTLTYNSLTPPKTPLKRRNKRRRTTTNGRSNRMFINLNISGLNDTNNDMRRSESNNSRGTTRLSVRSASPSGVDFNDTVMLPSLNSPARPQRFKPRFQPFDNEDSLSFR